ncbi:hypothetical protein D3C85_673900 [compost metagenome]
MITESRRLMWRPNHSIWSAYTFGVAHSTVAGRLRMIFFSGVGCQTSITASQTSTAKSSSVELKISGEYWKVQSVCGCLAASSLISLAALVAISITPALSWLKTMRRKDGAVAL